MKKTRVEIALHVPQLNTKLRDARHRTGLTQKTVARLTGTTSKTINHFECGLRGISFELLLKLCKLYRIDVLETLGIASLKDLVPLAS